MRQIVLDTETTGLSPEAGHRIIEIGCLELVNRRVTKHHFHHYINPERTIERAATDVHGITNDFLTDKPLFSAIVDELMDYLKGAELIIHNAPLDVGFIDHELKRVGKPFKPLKNYCSVVDSLALARRKHPGQHNSLDALCRRYSVDNSNRAYHGALLDAELLAQVYLLMTGGQTQLFDGGGALEVAPITDTRRLDADRKPLPVIKATDEELKAHEDFIESMCERE